MRSIAGGLTHWDLYAGKLIFLTPVHVGSAQIGIATDSPLIMDATGLFYIPGSSIAGALRARALERFEDRALVELVFGWQKDDRTAPSHLTVEDAYPADDSFASAVRDGVAIDRRYGAAYPNAKYDLEIAPVDIQLNLAVRLEVRENDPADEMRSLVFLLMEDFKNGKIRLGAMKSRGFGKCSFDWQRKVLDFARPDVLKSYLLSGDCASLPASEQFEPTALLQKPDRDVFVSVELEIDGAPFLIGDPVESDEVDAVFLQTPSAKDKKGNARPDTVPGSSIKGVFRDRGEKILRTLGVSVCHVLSAEESCTARIDAWRQQHPAEAKDEGKRDEAVKRLCCPACALFGNGRIAGRVLFEDAFVESPARKKLEMVAIDRFTGGASEGKLYAVEASVAGRLRFEILLKRPDYFERMLLYFILRDLKEGVAPMRFGYGKTKGFGRLRCRSIKVRDKDYGEGEVDFDKILENPPSAANWPAGEDGPAGEQCHG